MPSRTQVRIGTCATLSVVGAVLAIVFSLPKVFLILGAPTFVYILFWVR